MRAPTTARNALLLLASVLVGRAHAGCVHTGTSLMLNEDDFEDQVVKSDALITFVEFSSPWCIWAHPNQGGHGDCATADRAVAHLGMRIVHIRLLSMS